MANTESVNIVNESYKEFMEKIRDVTVNGYQKLTKQVTDQNDTIDKQIQRLSEESSPAFQRSTYEFEAVQNLLGVNTYMIYVFFTVLVGLILALYYNQDYGRYMKVGLFLAVALFPIYIYFIELILYKSWAYLYALATSKVYSDVYMNGY